MAQGKLSEALDIYKQELTSAKKQWTVDLIRGLRPDEPLVVAVCGIATLHELLQIALDWSDFHLLCNSFEFSCY